MEQRETIVDILVRRDGMTREAAQGMWDDAKEEFDERLAEGEVEELSDFCQEWFGLEPDYLDEFLYS